MSESPTDNSPNSTSLRSRVGSKRFQPYLTVGCLLVLAMTTEVAAQDGSVDLASYSFQESSAVQWKLPGRLREISGLATTSDDRLFGHDDEKAIIYEMDYDAGKLVKAFSLGDKPAQADFEGIAIVGDRFYLVTSWGRLYEVFEGDDDERMLYNTYDTGAGRKCEIEGLAYEPTDHTLLLLCKNPRVDELQDRVAIFKWSLEDRGVVEDPSIEIGLESFTDVTGKDFQPSAIDRNAATGTYFVVAAGQEAIAEITPQGEVLSVRKFPKGSHKQAEGVAFLSDNRLIVADEGGGGRARLTAYPRPR
jgi:uncharacterized protein YjiK